MEERENYPPPDVQDIRRALNGDQEAVLNIYLHYEALAKYLLHKYIRRFAGRYNLSIGNYPLEDMLQEMYLKLERAIRRFRG